MDWIINRDKVNIEIDPKYADDITFIRSEETKINIVERVIPPMLLENGLYINKSKTEKFHVSKYGDNKWKSCKYLGSLLGTEEDIKRRKGLAHDSYKTLEKILESTLVSEHMRIRVFRAYTETILLYNSELWSLTKTLENSINAFHRRLLRKVIHVRWPRTIRNEDLYERTGLLPLSVTICKRKLSWFGHLLRLQLETPARKSLEAFIKPWKRSAGKPKTTWLSTVIKDIKTHSEIKLTGDIEIDIQHLEHLCKDRRQPGQKLLAALYPPRG